MQDKELHFTMCRSESIDDSNTHFDKRPFWKSTSELDQQSLGQVHRDSKQQKPANEIKQYNSRLFRPFCACTCCLSNNYEYFYANSAGK